MGVLKTFEAVWDKKTTADIFHVKGQMYGDVLIRDIIPGDYALVSGPEYMKVMAFDYGFPNEFLDVIRTYKIREIVPAVPLSLSVGQFKPGTFDGEGQTLAMIEDITIGCDLKNLKIVMAADKLKTAPWGVCVKLSKYGKDDWVWKDVNVDVDWLVVSQKMPELKGRSSIRCNTLSINYRAKNMDDYYLKDKTLGDFNLSEQLLRKMGLSMFTICATTLHDTLSVPVKKEDGWKIDWNNHR